MFRFPQGLRWFLEIVALSLVFFAWFLLTMLFVGFIYQNVGLLLNNGQGEAVSAILDGFVVLCWFINRVVKFTVGFFNEDK